MKMDNSIEVNFKEFNIGLCKNKHNILEVTDGYIFPSEINLTDSVEISQKVFNKIYPISIENHSKEIRINLYTTGINVASNVALIEVINICKVLKINLVVYHYNKDINDYYPQSVLY